MGHSPTAREFMNHVYLWLAVVHHRQTAYMYCMLGWNKLWWW